MKKKMFLMLSVIMTLLVIGVGFAAWVIVTPASDSSSNGTITVDTVEEVAWNFETKWVTNEEDTTELGEDPVIKFGTPDAAIPGAWLTNTDIGQENLYAYLYVKATGDTDYVTDSYVTITVKDDASGSFASAVSSKYIKYPTLSKETLTADELKAGVVVTVTFAWGKHGNPYTYFNNSENNSTNREAAKTCLNAIAELSDVTYTLTVSTTAPETD